MAYSYVTVDRDQQFLLPPDVRDWLAEGHLAWLVLEVVERIDTSVLHARHPNCGAGRPAYDPDMLLGLLVYAYCTGQRSSRQIERLCEVDVAYRVLGANRIPDHTTIARFRQDHEQVAVGMFLDVLELCAEAGLAQVGVVAVDGTKMGADASMKANRGRAQLEAEVRAMLGQAAAVDAEEDRLFGDARGDELPADLADRSRRGARLDAALSQLEAKQRARAEADAAQRQARAARLASAAERGRLPIGRLPGGPGGLAEAQARLEDALAADDARRQAWAQRQRQAEAGERSRQGTKPWPPGDSTRTKRARKALANARRRAGVDPAQDRAQVNVVDPDSRLMKTAQGFVQGYNAQAAVSADGIIVAADVTNDANDLGQCTPMMVATQANLDTVGVKTPIGTMLFDAGYCCTDNLTADGPDRLIATTKTHKLRRAAKDNGWAQHDPPEGADPIRAMEHRLRTKAGAELYGLRQHTVEPVFGNIKDGRGFRRFVRRGLSAVGAEWQLICATNNLLKLHRHQRALA